MCKYLIFRGARGVNPDTIKMITHSHPVENIGEAKIKMHHHPGDSPDPLAVGF